MKIAAVTVLVSASLFGGEIPLADSAKIHEMIHGVSARSNIGVNHDWDPAPNWWYKRYVEKQKAIRNAANGEIDLLFVGDSITHNWEGARGPGSDYGGRQLAQFRKLYSVLDLGYGGDGTEQVLWRLAHGELDGFRTKGIMLLVGTNDTCAPEMTAARVRAILDVIAEKQPQATTLLLAIFPSGEKPNDPWRLRSQTVNRLIEKFADGKKVVWLDFGKRFLQADGTISKDMMPDFLHPRERGYDIWSEEVAPYFKRIVADCGGLSFDFKKISGERFKEDPNAVNLIPAADSCRQAITLVGNKEDPRKCELAIPIRLAGNDAGTRVRLSFHYQAHPIAGKPGRSIVFLRGQGFNDKGYLYAVLPETDEFGRFFSREFAVPAGLTELTVNPKVEQFGRLVLHDIRLSEIKRRPEDPEIEIVNTPMAYMGNTFAVSRNGRDIVNFQWRQVEGTFDLKATNEFVATIPAGFELVAPLNPLAGTVRTERHSDGTTEVRFATEQKPGLQKFDWWRRLGFMVTTAADVGTHGTSTFRFEQNGRCRSNVAAIELFAVPEIGKVPVARRFDLGVALAGRVGFFADDEKADREYAAFMVKSGIRWIKSFGTKGGPAPAYWREAGIMKITPESPIGNAYSVLTDPQPPKGERFEALHPKRGHWLSHSICPVAVYEEKPFFRTNILERLRRTHVGADGSYANWEPFFYREEGCMCPSCCAAFANWSKRDLADVAKDWPNCISRTGRFGKDICAFRSWQCAQVVRTLDRHVRALTGGDHSLGLIPAVHYEQATRHWIGHTDMAEYDMLDYGTTLRWICPWGPYSGYWDAAAAFGGADTAWMKDYFNAKDTISDFRRDYPGVKVLAYPHGLQETCWVIEPEILRLNLSAYFFFGWDAALVYFFPMGYDARYWQAIADVSRTASRYEDFVFEGARIDAAVSLVPHGDFPPPDKKANDRHFPSFRNVSYLQSVAYARGNRRIVAVFNYHPSITAHATLSVGKGESREIVVPAARMRVFEFGGDK